MVAFLPASVRPVADRASGPAERIGAGVGWVGAVDPGAVMIESARHFCCGLPMIEYPETAKAMGVAYVVECQKAGMRKFGPPIMPGGRTEQSVPIAKAEPRPWPKFGEDWR